MEKLNKKESLFYRARRYVKSSFKNIWYKSVGYLVDIRISCKLYTKNEKAILQYKNAYEGKACFVIGNGPSLRISDLEHIKKAGYVCFASNKIYKCFEQTDWRPDFYACTDLLVFSQNWEEIMKEINCVKFFSHVFKGDKNYKKWKKENYLIIRYKGAKQAKYFPDDVLRINSGGSVTYVLIALAWMMGFKTIYLIGCDHTYKFYETLTEKELVAETTEAIQKDYFVKDYMKVGEKMSIGNLDRVEKGYMRAKEHIEKKGGNIYNATRGGKLEVFERKDLDEIIGWV